MIITKIPQLAGGYTGSRGQTGYTGSLGYTGSQGPIGYTGSQGIQGITGNTGYTGSKGDIGYTGSQGNTGYTGSKGDQGIGVVWTGEWSSQTTYQVDEQVEYNGSQWVSNTQGNLNKVPGIDPEWDLLVEKGQTGYTGSRGQTGQTGYTGSKGDTGQIGPLGYTGSQGIQGVIGYTGSRGYTGSQSTVQGPIGYTGSRGQTGQTGPIGYTGSRGQTGQTGPIGYTGSRGQTGQTGYTGSQGPIGYTGSGAIANLETQGSTTVGQLRYQGTTKTQGQLYGGTTNPDGTTRVNYSGYFYQTRVYNQVYNDYQEQFINNDFNYDSIKNKIMEIDSNGFLQLQTYKSNRVIGIVSDSYQQLIQGSEDDILNGIKIPIQMQGTVRVKKQNKLTIYPIGSLIYQNEQGEQLYIYPSENISYYIGCIVGKVIQDDGDYVKCLVLNQ